MKKIFDIAFSKVRLTFKDKTSFALMFIAPILFVFIIVVGFGSGGSKEVKYPINVIDKDKGHYASELISMLKKDKTFNIIESDYAEAKNDIEGNKSVMGIVIPENFSKSMAAGNLTPLEVMKLQSNESTIAINAVLNNYIYQLKIGEKTGEASAETLASMNIIKDAKDKNISSKVEEAFLNNLNSPSVAYTSENIAKDKSSGLDGISTSAIGILVMFMMFFVSGGAGAILEEKEFGTWNRILSTPTNNQSIMGGFILGNFVLGWIQIGVLIIVSRLIFHVNWGNSILGLIMLFSAFLLAIIGFGVASASLVKSKSQLSAMTSMIVVPTSMIAGCFWPKDLMPAFMIKLADFVPQTWVLSGMTDLVARGSEISTILYPTLILTMFAAVFFIAGLTFMRMRKDSV